MTFNGVEGHSPIASLFNWYFSSCCTVIDKISTDIACSSGPSAVKELLVVFACLHVCDGKEMVASTRSCYRKEAQLSPRDRAMRRVN